MSRQNKNRKVIATRQQVTTIHKRSVESTGKKRTLQQRNKCGVVGFTKKLTSSNKGVCKILKQSKGGLRRVSVNVTTKSAAVTE